MLDFKEFLDTIQKFLGKELLEHISYPNLEMLRISRARINPLTKFLFRSNARLRGIFGVEQGKNYLLNYVFDMEHFKAGLTVLVATIVDKQTNINSISPDYELAEVLEQDVNNRLGIEFFLPKPMERQGYLCAPFRLAVESSRDNLFQYGIFDNIHRNNYYFEFNFNRNIVKDIELKTGWLFRGIQEQLSQANPYDSIQPILSRISGLMAVHHQIAYYSGVESLLKLKISNKVAIIRTLFAEIERIENHLIWFGNFMNLLSHEQMYVDLVKHWKGLIGFIKFLNNNQPHLAETLCLGGCIEISNETAFKALQFARQICPPLFNQLYDIIYSDFVKEKCSGIGFISREDSYKYGFTGPNLRASGNIIDIRHTSPYLLYTFGEVSQKWNVISFTQGDVYARAQVRLWEIKESYSIIEYILRSLETYSSNVEIPPITQDKKLLPMNEIAISKVESPHGELIYYLKTDPEKRTDKLYSVRIVTPDMLNFYGLRYAGLLGQKLSNIPNIIHSMDISFENVDL